MGKARLLIVEDDVDIANMLRIYFSGLDFQIDIAHRGREALEKTKQVLPHLIVLDIMLPDIDGYEVCRNLRTSMRTSHIPIIFLTQKDERSDKLQGLELGADDYITKPFDIEELKLRVQGAIRRSERESLTDPRSGLPAGRLIEDQLRRIIRETGWALLDMRVVSWPGTPRCWLLPERRPTARRLTPRGAPPCAPIPATGHRCRPSPPARRPRPRAALRGASGPRSFAARRWTNRYG